MLEALSEALNSLLGDARSVGAHSWLEAATWVATVTAAVVAALALRRQSFQSRAALLLHVYERWEALAQDRRAFSTFFRRTIKAMRRKHADLQNQAQETRIREEFCNRLKVLRDKDAPEFKKYSAFVSFFELLGMYARKGYLPLCDIVAVYKGPILDADLAFKEFIGCWQEEAHVPDGLFVNALYLMRRVRFCDEHPWLAKAIGWC